MTMPKLLTGLENLNVDLKKGLRMKVKTPWTPYREIDEEGNAWYVQNMPDELKDIRYRFLQMGEPKDFREAQQRFLSKFNPEVIQLAMPEWFGQPAPQEYPANYKPVNPNLKPWYEDLPPTGGGAAIDLATGLSYAGYGGGTAGPEVPTTPWGVQVKPGERALGPEGQEFIGGKGLTGKTFGQVPIDTVLSIDSAIGQGRLVATLSSGEQISVP